MTQPYQGIDHRVNRVTFNIRPPLLTGQTLDAARALEAGLVAELSVGNRIGTPGMGKATSSVTSGEPRVRPARAGDAGRRV